MEGVGPTQDDVEKIEGEWLPEWKFTAIDPKERNTWRSQSQTKNKAQW